MVLPRLDRVQEPRSGQVPQNLLNDALPFCVIATTCEAGQLTVLEVSSITKSSMVNPPSTAIGRGRGFMTVLCPFSSRCLELGN